MVVPGPNQHKAEWLRKLRESLPVPADRIPHARQRSYPTQEEMVAMLAQAGILTVERTDYNKLENGKRPISDDLAAAIARHFDRPEPGEPPTPESDTDRILKAMEAQRVATEAQAAAILVLADAVRQAFATGEARNQERADDIMRRLGGIAATVGVPAPTAPPPAGTPANTQTEGDEQDPRREPTQHRTRGSQRPKAGPPRPGWSELPPSELEASRGTGK